MSGTRFFSLNVPRIIDVGIQLNSRSRGHQYFDYFNDDGYHEFWVGSHYACIAITNRKAINAVWVSLTAATVLFTDWLAPDVWAAYSP